MLFICQSVIGILNQVNAFAYFYSEQILTTRCVLCFVPQKRFLFVSLSSRRKVSSHRQRLRMSIDQCFFTIVLHMQFCVSQCAVFFFSLAFSAPFAWLISRTVSANEQYFSLTINQPTLLSAMAYQPSEQGILFPVQVQQQFKGPVLQFCNPLLTCHVYQQKLLELYLTVTTFTCFTNIR